VVYTKCLTPIRNYDTRQSEVECQLAVCISLVLPMKKLLFWKKMLCNANMILCRLAKCCDASIFALAAKFHLEPHDVVRSSITCIKDSFWFYFSELV